MNYDEYNLWYGYKTIMLQIHVGLFLMISEGTVTNSLDTLFIIGEHNYLVWNVYI